MPAVCFECQAETEISRHRCISWHIISAYYSISLYHIIAIMTVTIPSYPIQLSSPKVQEARRLATCGADGQLIIWRALSRFSPRRPVSWVTLRASQLASPVLHNIWRDASIFQPVRFCGFKEGTSRFCMKGDKRPKKPPQCRVLLAHCRY